MTNPPILDVCLPRSDQRERSSACRAGASIGRRPPVAAGTCRPPAWFRYIILVGGVLMLCSCQAALPVSSGRVATQMTQTSASSPQPPARPAIYQQDPHTPPSAIRCAEYAAGIRGCPCPHCAPGGELAVSCPPTSPVKASRDEYLCDGGDAGVPAAVRSDWHIDGLQQEDTVAHYDTLDGRTIVTPSNRVCVYAPRFGVVRRVVDPQASARYDMPGGVESPLVLSHMDERQEVATALSPLEPVVHRRNQATVATRERQKLGELDQEVQVLAFTGSLAPYANLQLVRTGTVDNQERALVARASLAATTWAGDQAPQITLDSQQAQAGSHDLQPGVVYHTQQPHQPRLRLVKLASASSARPGEEIEFTLRFDNTGDADIGNVTIVDHLTTRLEYVEGSAQASLAANFSTELSSDGSLILRWEIKDPLPPRQGGVLQFKCRIGGEARG